MKNKGFTLVELLAVLVILAVLALVISPVVVTIINSGKKSSAESSVMGYVKAVEKQYLESLGTEYPLIAGAEYEVSDLESSLVLEGNKPSAGTVFLKEDGLVGSSAICMNGFYVTYDGTRAKVDPTKKCKELEPQSLITKLKATCQKNAEYGLIEDADGTCYFKGTNDQVKENYVWFGGHEWRIVALHPDNTITLVSETSLTTLAWAPTSGCISSTCQSLSGSNLQKWIDQTFLPSLQPEIRSQLLTQRVSDYGLEYSGPVRLLNNSEIERAATNTGNFLQVSRGFYFETITDGRNTTVSISFATANGRSTDEAWGVRPVIRIADLKSISGTGLKKDPYRDKREKKATNTNDIQAGSYLKLVSTTGTPYLVRVVSNDADGMKVILNGLLESTNSKKNIPFDQQLNSPLLDQLNQFLDQMDASVIDRTDHRFKIGPYQADFQEGASTLSYQGPIGLPVVGDLFSGNDINVSTTTKEFVDESLLSNPMIADKFWIINCEYNNITKEFRSLYQDDSRYLSTPSSVTQAGVRPVFYVKRNLSVRGSGSAYDPYVIAK